MTTVKQALESAITAFERIYEAYGMEHFYVGGVEVYKQCKSALAELESVEPAAYVVTGKLGNRCAFTSNQVKKGDIVYTSPQTREWVGLSDEAILEMCPYIDHDLLEEAFYRGARAVEDKLRALNTKG